MTSFFSLERYYKGLRNDIAHDIEFSFEENDYGIIFQLF